MKDFNVLRACAVADKKEDLPAKPSPAIEQARCYAPAVSFVIRFFKSLFSKKLSIDTKLSNGKNTNDNICTTLSDSTTQQLKSLRQESMKRRTRDFPNSIFYSSLS